jgi:hypothetical protein
VCSSPLEVRLPKGMLNRAVRRRSVVADDNNRDRSGSSDATYYAQDRIVIAGDVTFVTQ